MVADGSWFVRHGEQEIVLDFGLDYSNRPVDLNEEFMNAAMAELALLVMLGNS